MAVKICHASIDEHGKINGGNAGDQTSKEVCVRDYYAKNWNVVLRYKDSAIAQKAAVIAQKIANSNLVGYDQYQRNTLYKELKKNNWDVDKYIKSGVKTETDCSAFQYSVYCCLIPEMRADGNPPTTSTMRNKFKANEFTVLTESKYTGSSDYLMIGDVLVCEGHHTVMAINNGAKVDTTKANATKKVSPTTKKYTLNKNYKLTIESYLRTAPALGDTTKVKYASLNDTLKEKCIKDDKGYAKFKAGEIFYLAGATGDGSGNDWGKIKSGFYLPLLYDKKPRI